MAFTPEYVLPDLWPLCVPIDNVVADPDNVNKHPRAHILALQQTLRTYKQHKALVVQPQGDLLVCRIGNGTLEAAKAEGWEYIAVVRADSDDDVKAAARAIRDNTASWGSAFDELQLQTQLQEINASNPLLVASLGWDSDDLEDLLAASFEAPVRPEVFVPPMPDSGPLSEAFGTEPGSTTTTRKEISRKALGSSDSNEWYTPVSIVEMAREVMGRIDLDPASCAAANKVVQASRFYDEEADGFIRDWYGTVWLNPPYGFGEKNVSNSQLWAHRLLEQYEDGITEQACLLVNGSFGYKWFRPLWKYPICFFYNRIAFEPPEGVENKQHPTHSNVVVYMGDNVDAFVRVFSRFGRVVVPSGDRATGHGVPE